jgi:hypothetical protein
VIDICQLHLYPEHLAYIKYLVYVLHGKNSPNFWLLEKSRLKTTKV